MHSKVQVDRAEKDIFILEWYITTEAFFSRLQNRGVRIWQGVEMFPQHAVFIAHHAVFIAQQMLDQILKICKSFLKIGFF
jgi:hypothetical protein